MNNTINKILEDLYRLDPEVRNHEKELMKLIGEILESMPDTKFDAAFAQKLRAQLLQKAVYQAGQKAGISDSIANIFNHMTSFYRYAGIAAVVVIVVVAGVYANQRGSHPKFALAPEIVTVGDNAFGSLLSQDGKGAPIAQADASASSEKAAALEGAEEESGAALPLGTEAAISQTPVARGIGGSGGGGGFAASEMIVAPYVPTRYTYAYVGDELALSDQTVDVLRRVPGSFGNALVSQLGLLTLGFADLSKFDAAQMQQLSFAEDKDFGYTVNISFTDGSVSINENWERWSQAADKLGSQLSINEVPKDSELIALARKFLDERGISTQGYGEPEVVDDWRKQYESAKNTGYAYVPDSIQVRYPLLVNNETVYDQGGNPSGMMVNVNIRFGRVAGAWGLRTQQFERSSYAAVTDVGRIIGIAERGGQQGPAYYDGSEGAKEVNIELGTPDRVLVQTWNWSNNRSNELLVPALRFPVLTVPEGEFFYQQAVIVPLAQELLDQYDQQVRPMPMPLMRTEPGMEAVSPDTATEPASETAQ